MGFLALSMVALVVAVPVAAVAIFFSAALQSSLSLSLPRACERLSNWCVDTVMWASIAFAIWAASFGVPHWSKNWAAEIAVGLALVALISRCAGYVFKDAFAEPAQR